MEKIGLLLLFLCAFLLFSCEKPPERLVAGEPARVAAVEADRPDEELLLIAEDARDTLPSFFRHLNRPGKGESNFCVKYPFMADSGSGTNIEQLWLTGIRFKESRYYGIVANAPRHLEGIKKGDIINIEIDSITDWMYVRGGKIIGGYSIKYLLEQVPPAELSDNDRELLKMFY